MNSQILPLITSFGTMLTMWLAGDGKRIAWKVGIATNGLWWWYTLSSHSYGLIPLNACMAIIYVRNLRRTRERCGHRKNK